MTKKVVVPVREEVTYPVAGGQYEPGFYIVGGSTPVFFDGTSYTVLLVETFGSFEELKEPEQKKTDMDDILKAIAVAREPSVIKDLV